METNTKEKTTYEVKTVQEVSAQAVSGMICGAFEGGSTYWCESAFDFKYKGGPVVTDEHLYDRMARGDVAEFKIEIEGGEEKTVQPDIEKALQIMAKNYPRHFRDMVNENSDASTDDVFFQCLVFGEVIYG